MDRVAELPFHCRGVLLDGLRSIENRRGVFEFPSHSGSAVWNGCVRGTLWSFECERHAHYANHSEAGKFAGGMGWTESRSHQRCAFGAGTEQRLSAEDGREDCAREAPRDIHCGRPV